ncbi:MAG: SfiI family type II restriction endonuclease [Nitrospirota bacterium]
MERRPRDLDVDEIESVERCALQALWIATRDFAQDTWGFFLQSIDDPKDIAEDITREMLDRLGGYGIPQRIYGNVDYRKARYVIIPHLAVRQALFVDSKAEKNAGSATLQMSQLSMAVRQVRGGGSTDLRGDLQPVQSYGDQEYLATTLLAHYNYVASPGNDGRDRPPYRLSRVTLAAIPNGLLQERYNPDDQDTIWIAGRNAPSRGENFRVRLSFNRLQQKAPWRVQTADFDDNGRLTMTWRDA